MSEYFKVGTKRLYIRLTTISELIEGLADKYNISTTDLGIIKDSILDKEEEILAFGEDLRIEYEKNKLCKELTRNELFELKTIRDLNKSIDKVIK
jgi:hypothetical protein